MAKFEHIILPVSLEDHRDRFRFIHQVKGMGAAPISLEDSDWEFVAFWDGGHPYFEDKYAEDKLPLIKLAVFKRRIA